MAGANRARRAGRLGTLTFAAAFAAVGAVLYVALGGPLTVAPRLGPAPPFSLVDPSGRTVTHADMLGRPALYSFFPADPADATARAMAAALVDLNRHVRAELADEGEGLQLVTISVDPGRDTPERLAAFARTAALDTLPQWRGLTGPGAAVKVVVGTGFGVYYRGGADSPDGEALDYEPRFVLVDGRGIVRGVYQGPRLDTQRVIRDLRLVLQEQRAGGVARLAYEAAHLFLCDAR